MPEEINVTTKQYVSKENLATYDEKIKALINKIVADSAYDDTALAGRITANETAITKLKGTGDGSIQKTVDDAINAFATNISDDQVVNTFKELVDYVAAHAPEAATMAGDISALKTNLNALKILVGELPSGTAAKTIIEYIDSKVAGVKDWTTDIATAKSEAITAAASDATTKANTAKSEAIAAAAEDAATKANKALEDAKTYADGLAKNYATAAQGTKADSAVQPENLGSAAYMDLTEVSEDYINGLFTPKS